YLPGTLFVRERTSSRDGGEGKVRCNELECTCGSPWLADEDHGKYGARMIGWAVRADTTSMVISINRGARVIGPGVRAAVEVVVVGNKHGGMARTVQNVRKGLFGCAV